jgi:hypothetical protein
MLQLVALARYYPKCVSLTAKVSTLLQCLSVSWQHFNSVQELDDDGHLANSGNV